MGKSAQSHETPVNNTTDNDMNIGHTFQAMCSLSDETQVKTVDLKLEHLPFKEAKIIQEMVDNYAPKKVEKSPVEMKIVLTDEIPVYQPARRISPADKKTVEQQVNKWQGIIQASTSEYATPIVLVNKQDGTKRLCCDYRKINEKILRDNFPVANMDDVIEKLDKASMFITLDLQNGYFHVPMAEDSRKYSSFVTHNGQYEFLYVPFGISNSPAVFASFIHAVFRDLVLEGTLVIYVDDIIIPAKSTEECIMKFKKVLAGEERNGLKIKWAKSQ